MAEKATAPSHSRQPEMVFAGLTRLSTLPAVGRQVISELMQAESLSSSLRRIISSEPTLAAAVLSAMGRQGMGFGNAEPSVQRALQVLPFASIRSLLFEHPVLELFEHGSEQAEQRKQLIIHSIAVACCAERLARLAGTVDAQAAYTAGLLHDLGKLAMDERMPRSLARIMEQAEQRNCSTTVVEMEQLGVDHAVLGRQLAARWRLPRAVSKAIWLHHSDLAALGEVLPEGRAAPAALTSLPRQSRSPKHWP